MTDARHSPAGVDVVFAYDWPHRKLQDILSRLALYHIPVKAIVAAPKVELRVQSATVRTKLRASDLLPPRELAALVNAEFVHAPHDSATTRDYLRVMQPNLGVIAGARILPRDVIQAFTTGIINLHPGLLPEVRGLDSMLWAIHDGERQGVTGHLIDHRVDAGRILTRQPIPLYPDDTILDVSDRLRETEIAILTRAITAAKATDPQPIPATTRSRGKMPAELERFTIDVTFPRYIKRQTDHPSMGSASHGH